MQMSLKWICYAVGYVFITSGIAKLVMADFKVSFTNLGMPFPSITLFLVAIIEIACGTLLVANMYVKHATIPLIFIMIGAIFIAKSPAFFKQGVLTFALEARLDIVMLILLLILWQRSSPTEKN